MGSYYFHIYDQDLSLRLSEFRTAWTKAMSHVESYHFEKGGYRFVKKMVQWEEDLQRWRTIEGGLTELDTAIKGLLEHIRCNWPSIDLQALSNSAWERYQEKQRELTNL